MATYTVRMPDGSESTHRSLSGAQGAVRSGGFDSYTVDDRTSRGLLGGGAGSPARVGDGARRRGVNAQPSLGYQGIY